MKRFLSIAACAAAIGVSSSAQAQYTEGGDVFDATPWGFAFRIGYAFPLDDNLREVSDSFFSFGIDYYLSRPFFRTGETYFSLDWYGKTISGQKGNFFPLMVNHKWYTERAPLTAPEGHRSYFFAGLGAVFMDTANSDVVIGARGGVGVELGPYFFAEGALTISERASGRVHANTIGAYLGYRF
ncbi:MAG TPA: hypothetical protein VM328_01500 [Fimbriimonadaceae bacterium]|nr:hypothetical protein [Fimbriimonadaceae bacterium]